MKFRGPFLLVPALLAVVGLALLLRWSGGNRAAAPAASESDGVTSRAEAGPAPAGSVVAGAPLATVQASGLVLDATTGAPIAGATVAGGGRSTRTDAHGTWRLAVPAHGETDVDVRAPGYVPVTRTLPRPGPHWRVPPVFLTPVATRVFGRVVTVAGEPVAGAEVWDAVSGADGGFGPIPVGVGVHRFVATATGFPPGSVELVVAPGGPADTAVTIVLPNPEPLTGIVTDAEGRALTGVRVEGPGNAVVTDGRGAFRVQVAHGARLFVSFSREGYAHRDLWLMSGATAEVRLTPVPGLSGTLLLPDGTPAGAGFEVSCDGMVGEAATTDEAGRFSFPDADAGEHELAVWRDQAVLHGLFEVGPDDPREGLVLTLPPPDQRPPDPTAGRVLAGVVLHLVDAAGRPVAGALVSARSRADGPRVGAAYSDAAGAAELDLPAGKAAVVTATHPFAGRGGTTVLAPGEGIADGGEIVLFPEEGTRTIRIVDEAGRPVPGAFATATPQTEVRSADADGRVEIPGRWRGFTLRAPGRETLVDPGGGEVVLRPGGAVRGVVVDGAGRPLAGATVALGSDAPLDLPVISFTDGRGAFVLDGLPAGLAVPVRADQAEFYSDAAWAEPGGPEVRLTLARKSTLRLRFRAPAGVIPEQRTTVVVFPLDGQGPEEGWPLSLGRGWPTERNDFEVPVPAGRIALWVGRTPGGLAVHDVVTVDPDDGAEIVYDFPPPGRLDLTVRDEAGDPVRAAEVRDATTDVLIGWTGEDGRLPDAAAGVVPNGRVDLVVSAPGFAPATTGILDLGRGARAEMVLSRGVPFRGRVTDREGRPVEARIQVLAPTARPWFLTDEAGEFTSPEPVAPGTLRLEVRVEGRAPAVLAVAVPADGGEVRIAVR